MKQIINKIVGTLENYSDKRCCKCPAAWSIYSGEDWDDGCHIYRDYKEVCVFAFLPKWIVKLFVKYKLYMDFKHWEEWAKEDGESE